MRIYFFYSVGWICPFLTGRQTASTSFIVFILSSGVWYTFGFDESPFVTRCFLLIRIPSINHFKPDFRKVSNFFGLSSCITWSASIYHPTSPQSNREITESNYLDQYCRPLLCAVRRMHLLIWFFPRRRNRKSGFYRTRGGYVVLATRKINRAATSEEVSENGREKKFTYCGSSYRCSTFRIFSHMFISALFFARSSN